MSSKRLLMLEQMTQGGSQDPFVWYGLGMEYRSLGRPEEALATFAKLKAIDATYLPMYLMCTQVLAELGRTDLARVWIAEGLAVAAAKGDAHAAAELNEAAANLE